jgi:beta-mannosidase
MKFPSGPLISSSLLFSLEGASWVLSNSSVSLPCSVPGDLITDLAANHIFPGGADPLFGGNSKGPAIYNAGTWTYTTVFNPPPQLRYLVLEGAKMASLIYINGILIGNTTSQFLRYVFDVSNLLLGGANNLSIAFPPHEHPLNAEQRWMGCSGGWDWAPYVQFPAHYWSKGVWKTVYLIADGPAIEHVAPRVFYAGAYPQVPLTDATHGGFTVNVTVHFLSPASTPGTLSVGGGWSGGGPVTLPLTLPAGASSTSVALTAGAGTVALWWPAQTPGAQALYFINVSFTPAGAGAPISASRRVGFRTLALVTGNDLNPAALAGGDGSSNWTVRFKVNGADVLARGGNLVPMEVLEARNSEAAHARLVTSAVEGGFNMVRINGIGIYSLAAFYDAADAAGLLIYHDLAYAKWIGGPPPSVTQTGELLHNLRSLASHPSIAVWDACNECGGGGLYASFLMSTTAEEDPSRPVWPASPSRGWASGVDTLWGLPNGSPLGLRPRVAAPAPAVVAQHREGGALPCEQTVGYEAHGGYLHGSGFRAANSGPSLEPFALDLPATLGNATAIGANVCPGGFFSEFGASVPSSFESMAGTLAEGDWGLHTAGMSLRNYASDNFVVAASNDTWPAAFAATGRWAFSRQLYFAMLSQALVMKREIAYRRARNVFGVLFWQLNEIWFVPRRITAAPREKQITPPPLHHPYALCRPGRRGAGAPSSTAPQRHPGRCWAGAGSPSTIGSGATSSGTPLSPRATTGACFSAATTPLPSPRAPCCCRRRCCTSRRARWCAWARGLLPGRGRGRLCVAVRRQRGAPAPRARGVPPMGHRPRRCGLRRGGRRLRGRPGGARRRYGRPYRGKLRAVCAALRAASRAAQRHRARERGRAPRGPHAPHPHFAHCRRGGAACGAHHGGAGAF